MKNVIRHIHSTALVTSVQQAFARLSNVDNCPKFGSKKDMVVIGYGSFANNSILPMANEDTNR